MTNDHIAIQTDNTVYPIIDKTISGINKFFSANTSRHRIYYRGQKRKVHQ
jgi:hypothetical protein